MNIKYNDTLQRFSQLDTTKDYTLENITQACRYFDNPQNSFKSIHIAGTNGKGSTSKMIFQMLKESGKKVGVYTSPHNIIIRERFETERGLISEEDFIYYAEKIIAYGGLSDYEKCTLLAFLYFRDQGCEYAVIEVGMGGRLDATNIIHPVLSIITSISYDHMEFLGNTLEEIAYEKGGIIKSGIPVILYDHNTTLETLAHERSAQVIFPAKRNVITNLLGEHQISNARIAYEAGKFLGMSDTNIQKSLLHVEHHGRLEYIRSNLLVDGAHNRDGMMKLKNYLLGEIGKWEEVIYCFNLKAGKPASLTLDIFPEVDIWNVIDSMGFRVSDAGEVAREIRNLGKEANIISPNKIFEESNKNPRKLFVVFGSLYMMKEFLEL